MCLFGNQYETKDKFSNLKIWLVSKDNYKVISKPLYPPDPKRRNILQSNVQSIYIIFSE